MVRESHTAPMAAERPPSPKSERRGTVDVPETRFVKTADGLHIGYQVFGAGPYDVVFNDTLSNVDANWDVSSWAPVLRALGRQARVITFDRRGFGVSDRPLSTASLSLEVGVDDLTAILDATGSRRPVVMGFEWGSALSLLFAATSPERTAGLVLLNPVVCYWRAADFPWGADPNVDGEIHADHAARWGTSDYWREALGDDGIVAVDETEVREWAKWARLVASPQAIRLMSLVEQQTDVRTLLPRIQVPTLVVEKAGHRERASGGTAEWVASRIPGARYEVIPGPESFPRGRDTELYAAIDRFAREIRDRETEFDRVLATVLFTDIVGSTQLAAELGDRAWRELIGRHDAIIRAMLARYRGTEIDTAGDGFFATFDGPARAVRCAEAIRDAVRSLGIELRAGCHTGEVETADGKVRGIAVNLGARVAALAGASEVLVSSTVKDLTAGSGLVFEDAGEHELKGVPDRWRLYRVSSA